MKCQQCFDDPCTCAAVCLTKECEYPDCHVVIRWPVGEKQGEALCKWHQTGAAYPTGKELDAARKEAQAA